MLVTIIADASFCPQSKVSGYGYWILCDRGSLGGGGPLAKGLSVVNSTVSEMMAIVNALHIAIKSNLVNPCDTVLLQSDCMSALDALSFKRTNITPVEQAIVAKLNEYMLQHCLNLQFRHVKGHTNRTGARYVTNGRCDERAKIEMRKLRRQFNRKRSVVV